MKTKIYVIEDSIPYQKALEFEMLPKLLKEGITATFIFRTNDDTLEQDLFVGIDLILIDDDLGTIYGDGIIEKIDSFPEYRRLPIIYYSGGETLENLRKKTQKFGYVTCATKKALNEHIISHCKKLK